MSDPQLDDVLRELGDHGLEAGHGAAIGRVRDRLAHDLAAFAAADGTAVRGATGRASARPGRHRGDARRRTERPTAGRRPRVLVAAAASLATVATFTVTAAVALTAATGSPVPGFARGDTTNVFPDAGTTRITDARSADPTGGPAWTVRVGRTADGLVCVGAGQLTADGTFGVRGLDGRFRAVAPFGNDPCGPAPRAGRPLVQLRGFSGPGSRSPTGTTTVVFGSGGADLRSVAVATAGGLLRPVPVGDSGTFVLAVPGLPEGAAPQVRLRWKGSQERLVQLGRNGSVPDPAGRVGWTASTAYQGPAGCVTASILRLQYVGGPLVCGPLSGRQATLVPVRAMHGVGARLALLVRRDDGDRVTVTYRGREVPILTVRMAGRVRTSTSRVLVRDRSGRRRMVDRPVRTAGSGPTASLAILPADTRESDLRVQALRDRRPRVLPLDDARPTPSGARSTTPNGGR